MLYSKSLLFTHSLWNPMDCTMPGFPVHHQLPELTQTHVHWVGDVIQLSHPLSSTSPPAFNLSQFSSVIQWYLTFCDPMDDSMPGLPAITNSQGLLRLMSIESVMTSNHIILCPSHLLFLLPSIFPSIRVFSKESVLRIRWPNYWSSPRTDLL